MPLFMDFHKIDSDAITEEDVYRSHLKDVAVQNNHNLIYKKYYLNLKQKTAFCLIEGPNKEACIESHKEAHGVGACNVIEVSREHEFIPYLGEGGKNGQDLALTLSGEVDSGFRTIMLVDFLKLTTSQSLLSKKIVNAIQNYKGNVVKVPSEKIMASFIDAIDAIHCSVEIVKLFECLGEKVLFSMGLATGKPVDEHGTDLFEATKRKVTVLSRLGLQLGLCMDIDTKLAASSNNDITKIDFTNITVFDHNRYEETVQLDDVLMKNLSNSAFNSELLSVQLGLSKTQVYRKTKSLFGLPPNRLLSELRLIYAVEALRKSNKTISEVAYDSGFNSPTYFTRAFRSRFNITPTSIVRSKLE